MKKFVPVRKLTAPYDRGGHSQKQTKAVIPTRMTVLFNAWH